jgi:hypothetical protein
MVSTVALRKTIGRPGAKSGESVDVALAADVEAEAEADVAAEAGVEMDMGDLVSEGGEFRC